MIAYYNEEPDQIEITHRSDGLVNAYLRKNIEQTEDGWQAEEVMLAGRYSLAEIEDDFEHYYMIGLKKSMPVESRCDKLESDFEAMQAESDAAICELYELLIGEEE